MSGKELWSRLQRLPAGDAPLRLAEILELVPLAALVVVQGHVVVAANRAARELFGLEASRLPTTVIEATREARLEAVITQLEGIREPSLHEVRLVHRRRIVSVEANPFPGRPEIILFLTDVTQLRRLETVRQEFVANLSHELKTPIASLRLAAESLLGDPPPDFRRRFAQRVVDEATRLSEILDNLRQLAEIESGRLSLTASTFSLSDLLDEIARRFSSEHRLRLESADLLLHADRSKIVQVLGNLLDNAFKFSPQDSPVEVTAERERGSEDMEVVIRVRDHGPGISPEHREKVFERLYKVDLARSRQRPGSGLGLAIAKHLILAHHGRIWTENCPEGGQVFAFSLPQPEVLTGP